MKPWTPLALMVIALGISWLIFRESEEAGPATQTKPDGPAVKLKRDADSFEDPEPVSLADLLARSRSDLAGLCAEYEQKVQALDTSRLEGNLPFLFLSQARIPLARPIWQQARFSTELGMLVPPYLKEGQHDAALALHLARHGDVEGARKLAAPDDQNLQAQITALALPRNYPAEWTQLVALILDKAHFNLAAGNTEAAKRIASVHRQLLALLEKEAQQSPLGAVLLPRGRTILNQAFDAWRKSSDEELSRLAEPVLAGWGDIPTPVWPPIGRLDSFEHWLGGKKQGFLVAATDPRRARDLLGLPLPERALQSFVGFFGESGELREMLVAYGPELIDVHEPRHLSYWCDEQVASSKGARAEYVPEVLVTHANVVVGPLVRIVPSSTDSTPHARAAASLPRDFALLHLDRGFEHNRRFASWSQNGTQVPVSDVKILASVRDPLTLPLTQAVLSREGKDDLLAGVKLAFATSPRTGLLDVAAPLWQRFGPGKLEVTGGTSKDSVDILWEDGVTSYRLSVPHHKDLQISLDVRDVSGKDTAQRLELARARDDAERRQRWADQKPMKRLNRSLEFLELGMTRAALEKRLGRTKVLKTDIADGLLLTFPGEPRDEASWMLRQVVARFDPSGALVEARLRYTDAPDKKAGSVKGVLDHLRKRAGGAAEIVSLQEVGDAPTKKERQASRWRDDATVLLGGIDGAGVEVILRDCPVEQALGRPLPPSSWLPRGPENCLLGTKKEDLLRQWQIKTPVLEGDALSLTPSGKNPFDALLVWFEQDRVSRIVAEHREPREIANAGAAAAAVVNAWGQEAQVLGWPWQQKTTRQGAIQSWSNRDDVTRVTIFWEDNDGLRVFTEWR